MAARASIPVAVCRRRFAPPIANSAGVVMVNESAEEVADGVGEQPHSGFSRSGDYWNTSNAPSPPR